MNRCADDNIKILWNSAVVNISATENVATLISSSTTTLSAKVDVPTRPGCCERIAHRRLRAQYNLSLTAEKSEPVLAVPVTIHHQSER